MQKYFNIISILASLMSSMVIAYLWYGPIFGRAWQKAVTAGNQSRKSQVFSFMILVIGIFIQIIVMKVLIIKLDIKSLITGTVLGFFISYGFIFTTLFINFLYEETPLRLFLINSGYYVINLSLTGLILTAIR
jgi:hypothetical protein